MYPVSIGFSIKAVAERTGLSQHTIRAWERRYSVLRPMRTGTNRRVYEEQDVERLELLGRAVAAGHSIGLIASIPDDELRRLGDTVRGASGESATATFEACLRSVRDLDAEALGSELRRAASTLGVAKFLDEVVSPLLRHIGEEWQRDESGIAREHMASAVLRGQLEELRRTFPASAGAPRLVVTTPVSEMHEFGAMMAAVTAATEGWRVYYLGANLPAPEIARAANRVGAAAVALSVVHPGSEDAVQRDLVALAEALDKRPLLIGGSGLHWLLPTIEKLGARYLTTLDDLRGELSRLRSGSTRN